jgi:bis(5'-nucleosidyl)-tetraphosphatase
MVKERSSGAVIFRNEAGKRVYLLLHYGKGHWGFVKGNIEKTEDDKKTVVRETREETGITDLAFFDGFKEYSTYFYSNDGKSISKEVVYFLAETIVKDIRLSKEHIGYKWRNYEGALKDLTYDGDKKILKKANLFFEEKGTVKFSKK